MQITLNTNEVSECVLTYVKEQLGLDDTNNFVVELHEDGITVLVNEDQQDQGSAQVSTTERPAKKPRRTKAQIEADNKAEAERLAQATAASAQSGNAAESTEKPTAETPAVVVEAAGETTQEASAPGNEPEVDPSNAVGTTVVVKEQATEPVPENTAAKPEVVEEEEPPRKPTQSLFANLRKPNNG